MKTTMILTGALADQTIKLGNHYFTDGKLVLEGAPHEVDSAIKVLGRSYQAFMAGSDELESAQKRDAFVKEAKGGVLNRTDEAGKPGNTDGIRGDAHGKAGPLQAVPAVSGMRHDAGSAAPGSEGLVSVGSGSQGSGLHADQVKRVKDALAKLDPKTPAHWSEDGLPSIEALVEITKDQSINRAVVEAVARGFNQTVASEAADL